MLAHDHRADLQMPHRLGSSPGKPIETLAQLASELAQPLLLNAVGDQAGDEVARQRPWRTLPRRLERQRPELIKVERGDATERGLERFDGGRFRLPPRLRFAHRLRPPEPSPRR